MNEPYSMNAKNTSTPNVQDESFRPAWSKQGMTSRWEQVTSRTLVSCTSEAEKRESEDQQKRKHGIC